MSITFENVSKNHVNYSLKMAVEGIIRDGELLNDGYTNCIIYGLLRRGGD